MGNKELGERIKAARKRAGLTGEQLGFLLGLDKGKISLIEHGKRDVSAGEALVIARACSVTVDALLDGGEKPTDPYLTGCVCPKLAA